MTIQERTCPVCLRTAQAESNDPLTQIISYTCDRCGKFIASDEFCSPAETSPGGPLGGEGSRVRGDLSAWIRSRQGGETVTLEETFFDSDPTDPNRIAFESARAQVRTFHDRADELLKNLAKLSEYTAGRIMKMDNSWAALGWACDQKEFGYILGYLVKAERLEKLPGSESYRIDHSGWAHLEELEKPNKDSEQGFVAMWFPKEDSEWHEPVMRAWTKAIAPAIIDAGYRPMRIDEKPHANNIVNEIIAEIRQSRFIVADLTGGRGGVYFEAGFAQGLGIPVFFTCNKAEEHWNNRHFDINQFLCDPWTDTDLPKFKEGLQQRIAAVIGRGTYKPDTD